MIGDHYVLGYTCTVTYTTINRECCGIDKSLSESNDKENELKKVTDDKTTTVFCNNSDSCMNYTWSNESRRIVRKICIENFRGYTVFFDSDGMFHLQKIPKYKNWQKNILEQDLDFAKNPKDNSFNSFVYDQIYVEKNLVLRLWDYAKAIDCPITNYVVSYDPSNPTVVTKRQLELEEENKKIQECILDYFKRFFI